MNNTGLRHLNYLYYNLIIVMTYTQYLNEVYLLTRTAMKTNVIKVLLNYIICMEKIK